MNQGQTQRGIITGATPVSHRVVSAATELTPNDRHVVAEVPLASASDFEITLPPVASCPGAEIYISCRRASGSYSDGGVSVADQSDGMKASGITTDKLTTPANDDHIHVRNVLGLFWIQVSETTT